MKSLSSLRLQPSADFGRKLALPPPMRTSGLAGEELLDDAVVFGAPARMGDHRGGGGVFDLGVGDDADRHARACA